METLSNLPFAARLGLGFGALALALVAVGILAASRIGNLGGDVQQLAAPRRPRGAGHRRGDHAPRRP